MYLHSFLNILFSFRRLEVIYIIHYLHFLITNFEPTFFFVSFLNSVYLDSVKDQQAKQKTYSSFLIFDHFKIVIICVSFSCLWKLYQSKRKNLGAAYLKFDDISTKIKKSKRHSWFDSEKFFICRQFVFHDPIFNMVKQYGPCT